MRTPLLITALATALAIATVAHAGTRIGGGAAASAEATGFSADVDLGPILLEASLRDDHTKQPFSDIHTTGASVGALARLARRDRVSLYAGLRIDLYRVDPPLSPNIATIEPVGAAPLRIQIDVTPWLSIDAETALEVLHFGAGHGAQITPPRLGFTIWF